MQYRELGSVGLRVSAVGLGCARLGSVTQNGGDAAVSRLLSEALDKGITFFDTADIYGQGLSEKLLGKAIRSKRDQVVIATKAGYCVSSMGILARHLKPLLRRILRVRPGLARSVQKVRAAQSQQNFSRDYLVRAVEASLKRLGVDAIDLFQLHSPPAEILERGDVFAVLEELKKQGKIRHYGVSCLAAEHVPLVLHHADVAAVQVELNLLAPRALDSVLPRAGARKTGVIARQIFASGLLRQTAARLRPEDCGNRAEEFESLRERLRKLEQLASEWGLTVPELAIQFLRGIDGISVLLVGTTSVPHLRENLELMTRSPLGKTQHSRVAEIIGATGAAKV